MGYAYGKGIEYFGSRWLVEFEGSYNVCGDVTILRSLNLLGVLIVIPILVFVIQGEWIKWRWEIENKDDEEEDYGNALSNLSVVVSNFPLIMFFANLFYTDIWSTIFVLASLAVGLSGWPVLSAILSLISLGFRQTNIIWAAFIAVVLLIQRVDKSVLIMREEKRVQREHQEKEDKKKKNGRSSRKTKKSPFSRINLFVSQIFRIRESWNIVIPFGLVAVSFAAFVKINHGVTLGDKSNHQMAINVPQFFYFSLFLLFFSWPLWLTKPKSLIFQKYIPAIISTPFHVVGYVFSLTAIAYFVSEFTIIHPFILADNRHYTFYLWRRLINPSWHPYAKYILVPVYHFGLWILADTAFSADCIIAVAYFGSVALTLIPSPLFEPRYYIIPYVIWRILFAPRITTSNSRLSLEWVWYFAINLVTIYVFLYYPFIWPHERESGLQRFMW